MTLPPPGTPLWRPQKDDFAPRLGLAWRRFPNLVLRAGAGIFYDLGYADVADGASAFPYVQSKLISNTSFPLSAASAAPPPYTTSPPVSYLAVVDPNHVLPRTYEWNAAVERTLGKADVLTVTYLGAAGRRLMRQDIYIAPNPSFTGEFDLMSNRADSSYKRLASSVPPSPVARSSEPCSPIPGRIRSTMFPPTPISRMCHPTTHLCPRSVVRPTMTSGTRSRALSRITYLRHEAESGRLSLGTGRRIRSFMLDLRPL